VNSKELKGFLDFVFLSFKPSAWISGGNGDKFLIVTAPSHFFDCAALTPALELPSRLSSSETALVQLVSVLLV